MRLCLLIYPVVKHCYFAFLYQQYDYFRRLLFWFVDGKFIVLCVSTLLFYSLELYPFSALNPDCPFVWFWDSPWYLVLLVAGGTIMYDAYSHQPYDQWYCAFYQDQLVLPVSNSYQWAVKGMGCESVTLTLARALLVRLWVLVLLVDKHVPSICGKLMYIWAMLLTGQVFQ
jgi:hypothetical protein